MPAHKNAAVRTEGDCIDTGCIFIINLPREGSFELTTDCIPQPHRVVIISSATGERAPIRTERECPQPSLVCDSVADGIPLVTEKRLPCFAGANDFPQPYRLVFTPTGECASVRADMQCLRTQSVCPVSVALCFPVATSHSRTVSSLPLARVLPSGLKARLLTFPVKVLNVSKFSSSRVCESYIQIPIEVATASRVLSGEKAILPDIRPFPDARFRSLG